MTVSFFLRENGTTNVYVDDKLILSEQDPTPYQVLEALQAYVPGMLLAPFIQEMRMPRYVMDMVPHE